MPGDWVSGWARWCAWRPDGTSPTRSPVSCCQDRRRGSSSWRIRRLWPPRSFAGDDVEAYLRGELGMHPNGHLVGTQRLDRLTDVDATLVDLGAGRSVQCLGDRRDRHGAEEPAAVAGPDGHVDRLGLQLGLDGLRVLE